MVAEWPKAEKRLIDEEAEELMERLQAVIVAIRNTRAELNVPLESRPPIHLSSTQPSVRGFFETHQPLLQALALLGEISVEATRRRNTHAAAMVVDGIEIAMPLGGVIDAEREKVRLQQRVDELTKQLSQLDARLRDKQFTRKAPKEVVEQTRERRRQVHETLKKFSDHLSLIRSL